MYFKILFILCLSISLQANWKIKRENLDQLYQVDNFRLFYTLEGKDSIEDKSDINKNNIPDIVENVGLQLSISNQLFSNVFNLKSPLEQNRYKLKNVKFIDIHFLDMKGNGSSGDASIFYNYKNIKNKSKSLSIAISNKIKVTNLTPEHELLHAYQNGYTLFKNRWYTEGTARWSEYIFKKGTGKQHKLPSQMEDIHKLLSKTYDAKYFWNRLVRVCTKESKDFYIPSEMENKKYIGSDSYVIEGKDIYGIDFMRIFFKNLDYYDDKVSKEENLDTYNWKESKQKDFSNNKYILLAIKKTIKDINPKYTKELKAFLKALDLYLEFWENNINILDLTKNIEVIGTAYKNKYLDNSEDLYSRNIWDMKIFNERLYFGAGNASNSGPSKNSGPIPLISYDFKSKQFLNETIIDDEQINLFRIINNKLFIPGLDATQSHNYGNYYVKENTSWKKYRNIPNALHVFDIKYFDNKLFTAFSNNKGAAVGISSDFGSSWKVVELGKYQRAFSLITVDSKLYVLKQLWDKEKEKNMYSKTNEKYFFISEYKNGSFIPRYDLSKRDLFPFKLLKDDKTLRISKSESFGDKTVYLASYYYDNPFAFFISSSLEKDSVLTNKISIPKVYKPVDLIVNKNIYFLASKKDYKEYENIVYKMDQNFKLKALFRFKTETIIRSFELEKNDFYFGLGSFIKSKKKWKQKELHEDSGKIIKIKYID